MRVMFPASAEEVRRARMARACPISGRSGAEAVLFAPRLDCDGVLQEGITPEQAARFVAAAECRSLFAAVLAECLRVAVDPSKSDSPIEVRQTRSWVRSADFLTVCELAGFDGLAVRARVLPWVIEAEGGAVPPSRIGRRRESVPHDRRRAEIAALAEKGALPRSADLASRFGVSVGSITKDLRDLGMGAQFGPDARAERLAALEEVMDAPGFDAKAFAMEWGVAAAVVATDMRMIRGGRAIAALREGVA